MRKRRDAGAHILAVEDLSVTPKFLKRLLEEGDYRVSSAGTVREAQGLLEHGLPDLVVLDLLLPDDDGLELCRFLRTMPGGEDIPVLIITVEEQPNSHADAIQAGADDFLRKPVLPMELQSRVRSLIRLRQLRAELRRDREAILTLQAQKNELAQFLVHDLKNMLTSLLCGVELLGTAPAPHCVRHRQRIEETVRTMHGMVQNMLDISLHEEAGLVPNLEQFPLEPFLEGLQLEQESLFLHRSQGLEIQADPQLQLRADAQMLHRVIANLLENASKFGPPDSMIQLRAFSTGPSIRVEVADLGEGIPADKKSVVFDRFTRLESGSSARAGHGLGLAFCRMVLELHGGRIWVEDNAPQGSRFILELPAV